MAAKNGGENNFWQKVQDDSADTLGVQNYVEITRSHAISEINGVLHFTQKFKMAAKNGGKTILSKKCHRTLGVKFFVKIGLSRTVSKVNGFSCFLRQISR